jgi:DNA polymerase delta subunit 1
MLHVTDFLHYLYIEAPVSFTPQHCEPYKTYLDANIGQSQPAIHSVQMVLRENLYGFRGNQQNPYLKITVTDPKFIPKVRGAIEAGHANWKGMWGVLAESGTKINTYDQIQYVLRCMIDCKVGIPESGTEQF